MENKLKPCPFCGGEAMFVDKLWDVHCYNYFESGECIWGIRDGLDRRIAELADKEAAEKICEEHNKYFSEE